MCLFLACTDFPLSASVRSSSSCPYSLLLLFVDNRTLLYKLLNSLYGRQCTPYKLFCFDCHTLCCKFRTSYGLVRCDRHKPFGLGVIDNTPYGALFCCRCTPYEMFRCTLLALTSATFVCTIRTPYVFNARTSCSSVRAICTLYGSTTGSFHASPHSFVRSVRTNLISPFAWSCGSLSSSSRFRPAAKSASISSLQFTKVPP